MCLATPNKLYILRIKARRQMQNRTRKKNRGSRLELESRSELNTPLTSTAETRVALRDVWGLGRKTAGTIRKRCSRIYYTAGQRELRMVKYIEEFGAKLEDEPLGEMGVFRNREIDIPESGAVHCVATQISVLSRGRRERKRIDIAIRGTSTQNLRHTWHNVRALAPVETIKSGGDDSNGLAGHSGDDRIQLPT